MTKEETLSYLKAYLNGDTAIGNIIPLRSVLESAVEYLEHSLPSNLDEATEISDLEAKNLAGDYIKFLAEGLTKNEPRPIGPRWMKKLASDRFKAGAEWMAEQGVVVDAKVCKLIDRAWVTFLDEKQFQNVLYDKFKLGDKVVVQIRKK